MNKPGEDNRTGLEIAVIGMACRFPGARNLDEFWENLINGIEAISFFSDEELKEAGVTDERLKNPDYVRTWGVLQDIEYFDSSFFGYTPLEVEAMDPQGRAFHGCVWHALEDAGYNPGNYEGRIGLYAGASSNYTWEISSLISAIMGKEDIFSKEILFNKKYLSMLICYNLRLTGPAVEIGSTCSTSLVAIDMACKSLLTGQCDIALAGGVALKLPAKTGYIYQEGMVLSPDGHVRTFDVLAKGFNGGDGVGAVVLKQLDDAIAAGDFIYAVIRGSAINNDGGRKVGFTAPSVEGQAEVIRSALNMAEVEPGSIGYIETHGTATPLGDTIEVEALIRAFDTNRKGFCGIGSVKTNVGHLDSAAGVAGFIKTVLVLKNRLIPPSLHFENPNPKLNLIDSPFYVNAALEEWEGREYRLRAGVSSFGIGGTNAHVVLEEWPDDRRQARADNRKIVGTGGNQLILLSAKTNASLEKMKENLANYLRKNTTVNIADVAYTLQVGRKPFAHRWMAVCSSVDETIERLTSPGGGETHVASPEAESTVIEKIEPASKKDRHSLAQIGRLWLQGQQLNQGALASQEKHYRIPLPGYSFDVQVFKADVYNLEEFLKDGLLKVPGMRLGEKINEALTVHKYQRPGLKSEYAAPTNDIEKKLVELWEELFGITPIGIHDNFFELGGNSLKGITFVNRYREMLGEIVQIPVVFEAPNIAELAVYFKQHYPQGAARIMGIEIRGEGESNDAIIRPLQFEDIVGIRGLLYAGPLREEPRGPKNPPAIFILSAPRTGSTLLRVMLAGHPRLFAAPELNLLGFSRLDERRDAFPDAAQTFLQGTIRAIMQIKDCSVEKAVRLMQEYEDRQMTTKAFFLLLQEWLKDRRIVDKSTAYALDPTVFQRAEAYFHQPLYIHLLRHPYAMIRSYEEARMDLFLDRQVREKFSFTRRQWGELTWTISNQNIIAFLKQIPRKRQYTITFEQLVRQPEEISRELCQFLGLEFDPEMTAPYKEKKQRMTDGIYQGGMMVGDMKFHEHKEISIKVADTWRKHYTKDFLAEATWEIAESYGYQRIQASNGPGRIKKNKSLQTKDAKQLLSQLDQLSDEEVDALIREKLLK
jgi:3-oxoacyl-(acyl-carrier-protein) synthase